MYKGHSNSPAPLVSASYDFMHELKNNLILNAYTDKADYGLKLIITLAYRTKDGKIHQIANTETTV